MAALLTFRMATLDIVNDNNWMDDREQRLQLREVITILQTRSKIVHYE